MKLNVKNYHERGNHAAGVKFILCQLSERFWIVAAREEIREWDPKCNECKRRQLVRLWHHSRKRGSFVHCSRTQKTTTEEVAVPFYLLENSSSSFTFLNAFARFTSRHGVPKEVISDRGTNFVGAVGELKKLVSQLDQRHRQRNLGWWRFNPPFSRSTNTFLGC